MTDEKTTDSAASALSAGLGDLVEVLRAENATLRNAQKACEHCGPNTARWQDGEPANLEAAAADAYEWLKYLQARGMKLYMTTDEWNKLDGCMVALQALMAQTPNDLGNRRAAFGASELTDGLCSAVLPAPTFGETGK